MKVEPLSRWLPAPAGEPVVIAGPCSAESEEQVLDTARALAATGRVQAFRAGVWKPRTRPGGFQGLGDVALPWLQRVKAETGLLTATEVARAQHIEACLKAGVDILWIGARTVVNPFSVQELADALKGVDIPVLVKNPVSPDLGLWIGALERFHLAGIRRLAAVHRGFSRHETSRYRNPPEWQIAIELRERLPQMPLLCDPSHMGGDAALIEPLSHAAMDMGYDGLMIETHPNPAAALSDAKQQITPARLEAILRDLALAPEDRPIPVEILALRDRIDALDEQIVQMIAARLDLVTEIGHIKRAEHIPILQLDRWKEVQTARLAQAEALGIDPDLIQRLYQFVHVASLQVQERIVQAVEK
ncbi:bifunctional 3-deoxy-7-phosphoheptulonate synthase/chorismate mutase type II [Nostoc sp. NIES-2111]